MSRNMDEKTVQGFGQEWRCFHQASLPELEEQFQRYFSVFPWDQVSETSEGFDMGCGNGRWAIKVAPRVGLLHCIDASQEALDVAKHNLRSISNVNFHHVSVDGLPFDDSSQDFGYSLGVLHHIPDTKAALKSCWQKLKPGAPFLVYIYYAFDSSPWWFKMLWKLSDYGRRVISCCPFGIKKIMTNAIAVCVYWPLSTCARLMEKIGLNVDHIPLAQYRFHSFYTMRTDALDRFGTRLEKRFTLQEIKAMMQEVGFKDLTYRSQAPFWCVCGITVKPDLKESTPAS